MSSTPSLVARGVNDEVVEERRWWRSIIDAKEAQLQLGFAFPMILTNLSYYGITVISVMFAGHLGDAELAGASLGNSWSTITGLTLMTGLSGGLETLCGQSYGAKLYRMLGIYLQSSIIISFFFSILVSILGYYSEPVLIGLHQEPGVSKMAAIYLRYLIPGLFSYGFLQCLVRFLQTQTAVIPLVLCSVIPLLLHVGLAYLLIHVLGLGYKGASLSATISMWISFFMLAAYVKYSKKFKYTWEGLSTESFKYIVPSLKLAIPSAVIVCLDYWVFEILVLLAGSMQNSERDTSLIAMCVNTEAINYMLTYGLSAVVSTRVSNELGAGNIEKAETAVSVTLKLSVLLALTVIVLVVFGHNIWAGLFSSNIVIIREFASMTPLLAVSILFDSVQGILSGVFRGCGWQHLAAGFKLINFYGNVIPLAIFFGFQWGFHDKLRQHMAGKSIPVVARQLDMGDTSGPRHTRRRGIDADVRRQREEVLRREADIEMEVDADGEDADNACLEGTDANWPSDYGSDDSQSASTRRPVKGRGGRFVGTGSTSESSKRSRAGADDSWMVKGIIPGGPDGDTVIPSFLGHVASRMWTDKMRGILKCQNRATVCYRLGKWYDSMLEEAKEMIDGTGLSHLHYTMFSHVDHPLICAFIERWQPDTNTFHMPFGEVTIMLHDVWQILRLPVDGQLVKANPKTYDSQTTCMDFMGLSRTDFLSTSWRGGGVITDRVFNQCGEGRIEETQARAWVWILLGSTLFVDKSGNRIRPSCLHELNDGLESVTSYSWASATLAYLYRQLGIASRGDSQGIAGCLTLLQAWIYEYFPCFRPNRQRMIVDPYSPRACLWIVQVEDRSDSRLDSLRNRLDQMEASEVMWLPYGSDPANFVPRTIFTGWLLYRDIIEPYMPVRVLRQLGYVQPIPCAIYRPENVVRSWASRLYTLKHPVVVAIDDWNMFPDVSSLPVSRYQPCVEDPAACDRMYLSWYYRRSHSRLLNDGPPAAAVPLSRSNSEYWVNRLANMTRDAIKDVHDEDAAAAHSAQLEQYMKEWHLAN